MILESDWEFLAWVTACGFLVAVMVVWQMYRTFRRIRAADEQERLEAEESAGSGAPTPVETGPRPKFFKRYVPEDGADSS